MQSRYLDFLERFIGEKSKEQAAADLGIDEMTLTMEPETLSDNALAIIAERLHIPPETLIEERGAHQAELAQLLKDAPPLTGFARLNQAAIRETADPKRLPFVLPEATHRRDVLRRLDRIEIALDLLLELAEQAIPHPAEGLHERVESVRAGFRSAAGPGSPAAPQD